jgi:two-component system, cell cycle sensor histidine kinase and response regulator CckA
VNSPLQVLIVEDSEDDMLLMLWELRRSGYPVNAIRVETPAQMQTALARQSWDVVIADYSLPKFSALEALKLLQSQQQDWPFIIVSGTITEETAVAAMKAGAHDYITKGNLARLVPAVERELREAEDRQKRHRAEQALGKAEQKIREQAALLEIASDAIFVRDLEHHILYWNQGAERLYGWQAAEAIGQKANDLLRGNIGPPAEMMRALFEQGEWCGELSKATKMGKEIIVAARWTLVRNETGEPKSILSVETDITEKKALEAQFLRVQRLESLGTLAGGIAHDLNNILTPILAMPQILRLQQPQLDDRSLEMLTVIETSAKRGANLVKQILTFTRGSEGERRTVQVSSLLREVIKVIEQTFPKAIAIREELSTQPVGTVFVDPTHLHQVLMNLCVNARDAMPDGGILTLAIDPFYVDDAFVQTNLEAQVGHHVLITIADTGTGISPEVRDCIFDPFFTTKAHGHGTGLGLATVLGIVKTYGGFVQVCSEVGQGTQFKIYLPTTESTTVEATSGGDFPQEHGGLVLIVDDDPIIQKTHQALLESYAYTTLIAQDGIEAISLYRQRAKDIRSVLMDVMMPNMDGISAIRTLKTINPKVHIVAMSGLSSHREAVLTAGANVFLSKPFTAEELLQSVSLKVSYHA